jgi:hypothetical protein
MNGICMVIWNTEEVVEDQLITTVHMTDAYPLSTENMSMLEKFKDSVNGRLVPLTTNNSNVAHEAVPFTFVNDLPR